MVRRFGKRVYLSLITLLFCLILCHLYKTTTKDTTERCYHKPNSYVPPRHMLTSGERLSNLKHYCQTHPSRKWSNLTEEEKKIVGKHVIVDDKHGLLYCYIPKVGCSNWKRVMLVLTGKANSSSSIRKVSHKNFVFLSNFPPLEIERRLKTHYKFLFTREPMERLVSAYKDKFIFLNKLWKHWSRRIVSKYREGGMNTNDIYPTLPEFFKYLVQDSKMNEHWMSYVKLCQPCAISYDFMGSFDCLERDSKALLEKLHLQNKVQFPTKQKYYTRKEQASSSFDNLISGVPQYLIRQVVKKFSQDYEMFSYLKPEF